MRIRSIAIATIAMLCAAFAQLESAAAAGDGKWELLGRQGVNFKVDRDVIDVGKKEGKFTRIKLKVLNARINLYALSVKYANGAVERLDVKTQLKKGAETRAIDLAGRGRYIRQIELVYRSRPKFKGRGTVEVYGLKQVAAPAPASSVKKLDDGWDFLGEKRVAAGADRDIIDVGRKEGRYSKLRLSVLENGIRLYVLKVHYANGTSESLNVDEVVNANTRSRAFDLAGEGRFIRRIELVYRSRDNNKGRALVKVYGQVALDAATNVPDGWDVLGQKRVGLKADRDTIQVSRRDGRYTRIQLRVRDNGVQIDQLKVTYGNGVSETLPVRANLRAGSATRAIDLRGGGRYIDRIELNYRSRPGSTESAVVEVLGFRLPEPQWQSLGSKRVGFQLDHDVIEVGAREGTFRRIKLKVSGNDIFIVGFKVVYGNGSSEEWRIGAMVPAGAESRAIDLQGKNRFIRAVELLYKTRPNFNGKATVEVLGLQ